MCSEAYLRRIGKFDPNQTNLSECPSPTRHNRWNSWSAYTASGVEDTKVQ